MTENWRDLAGNTGGSFGLGQLSEGEELTVTFENNGEVINTEYGESAQFHVTVDSTPEGFEDMNGESVESGEEYYLMSSSAKLLHQFDILGEELEGTTVTIEVTEGDSDFDREYTVTEE